MQSRPALFQTRAVFLVILGLLVLQPALVSAKEIIQIGGTGTGIGIMKLLGETYEKKHADVRIEVLPSLGTPGGIKAALSGVIGLAVAGRPLTPEEEAAGAVASDLGRTPFVFVAHAKTTKPGFTSRELVDIYAGRTTAWPDGMPIRLILRPAKETSSVILKAISPDMEQAMAAALGREGMIYAATDQDSAEAVTKTQGSLGTSTLVQVITEHLALRVLDLNGVKPSVKSLADGSYPLYKPLLVVTTPRTLPAVKKFVEFLTTPEARSIMERAGLHASPPRK